MLLLYLYTGSCGARIGIIWDIHEAEGDVPIGLVRQSIVHLIVITY